MITAPFTNNLPRKKNHSELKKAVCQVIDLINDGAKFTPRELHQSISGFYPELKETYLETILRYMRMYRRNSVICVDRANSVYMKVTEIN